MSALVSPPIAAGTPLVDPSTGGLTTIGFRILLALWERTGGATGTSSDDNGVMGALSDIPDVAQTVILAAPDWQASLEETPDSPAANDPMLLAMLVGDA